MVSGIIGAGLLSTLSLSIFRLLKLRLPRSVLSFVITSLPSFDPISPFTYFFTHHGMTLHLPINLFLFLCVELYAPPVSVILFAKHSWGFVHLFLPQTVFGTALKC